MPELITDIGLPSLSTIDEADARARRNRRATLRGYYLPVEFVHALRDGDIDSVELTRQRRHYANTLPYWRRYPSRVETVADRFAEVVERITGNSVRACHDCDEVHWDQDLTILNNGDLSVCQSCYPNYFYCTECDEHYHNDDAVDHEHEPDSVGSSVCEVPSQWRRFALPLADGTTLQSDTDRRVVQKPAINRSARRDIWEALAEATPHSNLEYYERTRAQETERAQWRSAASAWSVEMNNEPAWQTPAGNLTKRLRKFFLQREIKLNDKLVERIGNLARSGMGSDTEFDLRVTRELNGSAAEYNNDGSCWWGSYSSSRCMLKQCGGFALMLYRNYDSDRWSSIPHLVGRSWVIPLKRSPLGFGSPWQPTHNLSEAVAYAVINSYYDDDNAHPAEALAELMGMEHKGIRFAFDHMFVNGDACRLVASRDILDKMDDSTWIELSYDPGCGCDWNVG